MKEWTSPVYAFFDPTLRIIEKDGQQAHEFKCSIWTQKDAQSTGNMRKHVKSCWGDVVLQAADDAKDASEVRTKIIPRILQDGSIMASFERKGKGKVTYSNHQHTRAETKAELVCWVSETLRLFKIEYEGKISFTTDTWTSTNHRAFVAVSVRLEHNGVPLSLPLDIVEVVKVC
ncbi:hypothetical protein BDR03DRAFT_930691 [Suillus americanus]|nr:hypothetical protein BDR03DRAFT_930691 [Suillus americanus]